MTKMTWEKTVMSWERIRMVFQEQDKKGTTDNMFRMEALCERQAEVSFKAGYGEGLADGGVIGRKFGIQTVVEWLSKYRSESTREFICFTLFKEAWEAKLKDWGITEEK